MSEVFDCTTPEGLAAGVEAAARAVQSGQVVVLPTDTVYGIGCDAFDASAVTAVLAAKGRGRDMPPPVLVPQRPHRRRPGAVGAPVRPAPDRPVLARRADRRPRVAAVADLGPRRDQRDRRPAHAGPRDRPRPARPGRARWRSPAPTSPAGRRPRPSRRPRNSSAPPSRSTSTAAPPPGGYASTILDCTGDAPVTLREGALTRAEIDVALDEAEKREAEEAARAAAVAAAATEPPRSRPGPRIAGSRRRERG